MTESKPSLQLIQVGVIETETHEVIQLIDSYALPADLFNWLSNCSFTSKIMKEEVHNERYIRISQFHIQDELVFSGRAEFNLPKLPKETIQFLTIKRTPMITSIYDCLKFTKAPISKIATEQHYTVISQLIDLEESIGFSWEVYELPEIVKIYDQMHDPLRHWKHL